MSIPFLDDDLIIERRSSESSTSCCLSFPFNRPLLLLLFFALALRLEWFCDDLFLEPPFFMPEEPASFPLLLNRLFEDEPSFADATGRVLAAPAAKSPFTSFL